MSKTAVYSWRVSPELKRRLESAAHEAGTSVGRILEVAAEAWLERDASPAAEEKSEQDRLRRAILAHAGAFTSGDRAGSSEVEGRVRERIATKIERRPHRAPARAD